MICLCNARTLFFKESTSGVILIIDLGCLKWTPYLDLESSLEAAGEEPSKGADDRGEDGHEEGVQQKRVEGDGLFHPELQKGEEILYLYM